MIKSSHVLASLANRASEAGCVAVDTEFVWERTYYPTLGIVQIALSEDEAFIVDMLEVEDFTALGEILSDERIVKILHDAPQDLTILRRTTGAYPRNVFDTRLAAGFAGLSSTVSLSGLLKEILGLKLTKTETRSDWLKRPLTRRQLSYALDDVRYLPVARRELLFRTENLGHVAWLEEEMTRYDAPDMYEENIMKEQFLRVKGVNKLSFQGKSVLRELASWREGMAREKNYPRSWIISDQMLIKLAQQEPLTIAELESIEGLTKEAINLYGTSVVDAIRKAHSSCDMDKAEHPEPVSGNKECFNARVDLALAYMKGKSLSAGIDPALVATRAEVTALVRESETALPENHRLLRGWRREFLGEELLELADGRMAVQMDAETGLPVRAQDY